MRASKIDRVRIDDCEPSSDETDDEDSEDDE